MSRINTTDDFVEVLVPRDLVIDVYRFISEKSGSLPTQPLSQPTIFDDRLHDDWSASLIRRMYAESAKNMRAILDTLATHAGKTVTATELIKVLSRSRGEKSNSSTLGGTLGAFGRRVKNRYGQKKWPFEAQWNHESLEVHYMMSPEVAAMLKGE